MDIFKKFIIFITVLFVLVYKNDAYANNILNCPTCNLEKNMCKNCNKKINKKPNQNLNKKNDIKSKNTPTFNKLEISEKKCLDIGLKKGTERYGECVLKLLDLN